MSRYGQSRFGWVWEMIHSLSLRLKWEISLCLLVESLLCGFRWHQVPVVVLSWQRRRFVLFVFLHHRRFFRYVFLTMRLVKTKFFPEKSKLVNVKTLTSTLLTWKETCFYLANTFEYLNKTSGYLGPPPPPLANGCDQNIKKVSHLFVRKLFRKIQLS